MSVYPGPVTANDCQPCSAPRTPDAERIMILLDELVKQSEDLACFAASKLASIVHSEPPSTCENKPLETSMSPLFNEYRSRIGKLRETLSRARYTIERVEV